MKKLLFLSIALFVTMLCGCKEERTLEETNAGWFHEIVQEEVSGTTVVLSCETRFADGILTKDNAGFSVTEIASQEEEPLTFDSKECEIDGHSFKATIRGLQPQTEYRATAFLQVGKSRIESRPITVKTGEAVIGETVLVITSEKEMTVENTASDCVITYKIENPIEGKSLAVECKETWVKDFDLKEEGKVTFKVDANTGEERHADIVLAYGASMPQKVSLKQKAAEAEKEPVLTVTSGALTDLKADKGTYKLTYTLTNPKEGVKVEIQSNQTWVHGFVTSTPGEITMEVDQNTGEARQATLTLTYGKLISPIEVALSQKAHEVTPTPSEKVESILTVEGTGWPTSYTSSSNVSANGVQYQLGNVARYGANTYVQFKKEVGYLGNVDDKGEISLVEVTYAEEGRDKLQLSLASQQLPGVTPVRFVDQNTRSEIITPTKNGLVHTFNCASYKMHYFSLISVGGASYVTSIKVVYGGGGEVVPPTPSEEPSFEMPTASEISTSTANLSCMYTYAGDKAYTLSFLYRKASSTGSFQKVTTQHQVIEGNKSLATAALSGLSQGTTYEVKLQMTLGSAVHESGVYQFTTYSDEGPAPQPVTGGLMEMPEKKQNSDLYYSTYICEQLQVAGKRARNYSVCYSKSRRTTLWVAAPMHKCYRPGSYHRTDAWSYAPEQYGIPRSVQPNLHKTYKASGHSPSRGHMVCSSDRYIDNKQTFYYTNMTCQWQPFNGGFWNQLEQSVQSWGDRSADTLYVVTGAIYARPGQKYATDNDGQRCDVPTHYYKAVIRSKSQHSGKSLSQLSASELECAAWLFDHEKDNKGKGNLDEKIMSVKDLENQINSLATSEHEKMNFFVNIPNAPKATLNRSSWHY